LPDVPLRLVIDIIGKFLLARGDDVGEQVGFLTLLIAGSVVAGIGGILLVLAWQQMRHEPAILWWAGALLARGMAGALLAAGFGWSVAALIVVGAILIPVGGTASWLAARIFQSRSALPQMFAVVVLAWLAGLLLVLPLRLPVAAAALACGIALASTLHLAVGLEFWLGRSEKLTGRWPFIVVSGLQATIFILAAIDVALGNVPTDVVPPLVGWFSLAQFEFVIVLLACAVLIVMMARERMDAHRLAQAGMDSLTGVANRATFFEQAEKILRRAAKEAASVSVIMFDLDHFKKINDTYGHASGDRVLRRFTDTARGILRLSDVFGRIGGEEFSVVLPNAGADTAYVIAERIRRAFEMSGFSTIKATVSAGVATNDRTATLNELVEAADRALYQAKSRGRNGVERADRPHALQTVAGTPAVRFDAVAPKRRSS
jgi:diguanylate cyclase (GGDEF)-like protein